MENQIIEENNIIYSLKDDKNTSFIIEIFIPRSINQGNKEYEVIGILPKAFKSSKIKFIQFSNDSKLETIDKEAFSSSSIKSIKIPSSVASIGKNVFVFCEELEVVEIPNDSKLQTIGKYAFFRSKIKNIRIPSELIELKEGWCCYTPFLTKIEVSPKNQRYCCFNEKMIIGKMNIEDNNYNCLIFCVRDIQHITIPNFIEHICSYSFDRCEQLEIIEIPNDSKLQTIDENAFYETKIKCIKIPSSVTSIGKRAFSLCVKLEIIEIPNDSKLQTIDKEAFFGSSIKSIMIPSSVTTIGKNAFYFCRQLLIVEINNTN